MVDNNRNSSKGRFMMALAVTFGGGLLPGTCEIRTREAFIDGSKSFLANVLLNPANFTDLIIDSTTDGAQGNE